jgi:hypothetical protein
VVYDAAFAVNLVTAIAVVATAAYAAENLHELKLAREAEFTPVLDVMFRYVRVGRERELALVMRNIGRGAAAGLEVAVWWLDPDLVMWLPHRIDLDRDLLLAGESATGRVEYPWMRTLVHKHTGGETLPAVVLQLRYRDALRRQQDDFVPYD